MDKQFENMQKLAFGKVLINESMESKKYTKKELKAQIREMILDEAKKKKKEPEDVAPQEDVDVDVNMGTEPAPAEPTGEEAPAAEEAPMDTMAPEATVGDINPTVKSIQDSLQRAFVQAKQLGDEKLATQIGNTLTMLLRDQVLGQQSVAENESIKEDRRHRYVGKYRDAKGNLHNKFIDDENYVFIKVKGELITIEGDGEKKSPEEVYKEIEAAKAFKRMSDKEFEDYYTKGISNK